MTQSRFPLLDYLFYARKRKRRFLLAAYRDILNNRFAYFSRLSTTDQERFLDRLYRFRRSKKFHYVGIDDKLEISVLVCAAAIQLTFGLEEYRIEYFRNIYIMKGAYTYGLSNIPWAGHVNRKGIHVSWDHVQRGYHSDNDGYNVGLHEMAHALEYEFSSVDYEEWKTKLQFKAVRRIINETILQRKDQQRLLFSEQGLSNVHECWAESVELFFENPIGLQQYYPELYEGITLLLKQDPEWEMRKTSLN